ncbi:hypothetical protein GLYMA_20G174100v4 [Glycine max]|uniref:Uncharacterized protein n=1 Tax=Glycine max TaxID=3847 RepID=A0A0R0ECG7_SOYBN|nr:hypothetical protein GYH30_056174 [Glycine max]KRG91785.1 hypothetical protein GLYMA_20G174100v4 [Glycine max]
MFGDSLTKKTRPRAIAIFVVGFWILDVANNMLQGPCRALLQNAQRQRLLLLLHGRGKRPRLRSRLLQRPP